MKLYRMVKYDIYKGMTENMAKWILPIVLQLITCILCYRHFIGLSYVYGTNKLSAWDFGIWSFLGRLPYDNSFGTGGRFTLPFEWIIQYLVLSYLVGGYVRRDMGDYGIQLMIKSRKRSVWWTSKCIWCVLMNLLFFTLIWGVNIGCSWMFGKNNIFSTDEVFMESFNLLFLSESKWKFILIVVIMPILAGIVQSMFQILLSLFCGDIFAIIVVGFVNVFSVYYSHPLLPAGYSMLCRYTNANIVSKFTPLNYKFGFVYLIILMAGLCLIGYLVIRRKDI